MKMKTPLSRASQRPSLRHFEQSVFPLAMSNRIDDGTEGAFGFSPSFRRREERCFWQDAKGFPSAWMASCYSDRAEHKGRGWDWT
jgi:hypothetical protein